MILKPKTGDVCKHSAMYQSYMMIESRPNLDVFIITHVVPSSYSRKGIEEPSFNIKVFNLTKNLTNDKWYDHYWFCEI